MGFRYIVLRFDDGDRFDYDPPLLHPADNFLGRFEEDKWLNANIGAIAAYETQGAPLALSYPIYPPTK